MSGNGLSRTAKIVVLILSLAVGGAVAIYGVHRASNRIVRYPPAAERGFLDQCEQSSSVAFCTCVLRGIEQRYTYERFVLITGEYARTGALPPGAVDALAGCAPSPSPQATASTSV